MSTMTESAERLEREAFEAWAVSEGIAIARGPLGGYRFREATRAWKVWQAARRAPAEAGAPSGWKLVPIEPTEAMLDACCDVASGWPTYVEAKRAYDGMLAAAPASQKQEG